MDSPWPEELDAVIAAPEHHRLALDHEKVRVLETLIHPGETVRLHTHTWPAATYVLAWSDCVRRDENGEVLMDSRLNPVKLQPGQAIWNVPLGPHTLENVGDGIAHLITVEIKTTA